MDGIHDLGGKQGYGPVDVNEPDEPFNADWEARVLGIVRAMSRPPDWSIDWFRHCRELIDPVDYLSRPYYDQWLQTYAAMLVNSAIATVDELATGKSRPPPPGLPAPMAAAEVGAAQMVAARFDRDGSTAPVYAVGDGVRAASHGIPTHTRLPAYARGRIGVITAIHGAHVLPDASARGDETAEPLYTVAFAATELWLQSNARDRVHLDLWESYLERA